MSNTQTTDDGANNMTKKEFNRMDYAKPLTTFEQYLNNFVANADPGVDYDIAEAYYLDWLCQDWHVYIWESPWGGNEGVDA